MGGKNERGAVSMVGWWWDDNILFRIHFLYLMQKKRERERLSVHINPFLWMKKNWFLLMTSSWRCERKRFLCSNHFAHIIFNPIAFLLFIFVTPSSRYFTRDHFLIRQQDNLRFPKVMNVKRSVHLWIFAQIK